MTEESVGNVLPVVHGLPTSEGCSVQDVQNPALALDLAGAIGHGAGRRLNGRDGNPFPVKAWVAL